MISHIERGTHLRALKDIFLLQKEPFGRHLIAIKKDSCVVIEKVSIDGIFIRCDDGKLHECDIDTLQYFSLYIGKPEDEPLPQGNSYIDYAFKPSGGVAFRVITEYLYSDMLIPSLPEHCGQCPVGYRCDHCVLPPTMHKPDDRRPTECTLKKFNL